MIVVKGLDKVYPNGFHAVKAIDLEIKKGDIFGIIGLSGAGKSSLIRMLNRLEEPTAGTVSINGENIINLTKKELLKRRQKIGMIFQNFNLLASRTVEANIAFSLEIAKWEKHHIKSRIKELLELVGLEDKAGYYPAQLSGGQKQRVAIARALANNPDILLSDEATSALDPKTRNSILDLIKEIQKKFNLTVVMITHQMEVVRDTCNKVAVMSEGEIVEVGNVHHIFLDPKSETTKDLISHISNEDQKSVNYYKNKGRYILNLKFIGEISKEPILSKIIRDYNIDLNILGGTIDNLSTLKVGHLLVELSGDIETQKKSIETIKEIGLKVEVVYDGL